MADAHSAARTGVRSQSVGARVGYDAGLRQFFAHVFGTMGFGLAISGFASLYLMTHPAAMATFITGTGETASPTMWWFASIVAYFVLGLGMIFFMRKNNVGAGVGLTVFAAFALATGIMLAPALAIYTTGSVAKAFFLTAAVFGGCALWGYTTKRDLTQYGELVLMGLIGLLIAMVVNMFLRAPMMDYVISACAIALFMGITAYDIQSLEEMYNEEGGSSVGLVINGALSLYLDFVNLLLHILRFVGEKK